MFIVWGTSCSERKIRENIEIGPQVITNIGNIKNTLKIGTCLYLKTGETVLSRISIKYFWSKRINRKNDLRSAFKK